MSTITQKADGLVGAEDRSEVQPITVATMDLKSPTNRFDAYSLADLAGQCRIQARHTLDPELTDFWEALNRRLTSVDAEPASASPSKPQPKGSGERKTAADCELMRLDEVRRIITAIAAEFGGRIIEKPALADALLATIIFLQGADYVRDWVGRGGRTPYQAHHGREAAAAKGLTEISLSAETISQIREAVLGVRS